MSAGVSKQWDQKKFRMKLAFRDYTYAISAVIVVLSIIGVLFGTMGTFFVDNKEYKVPEPFFTPANTLHEENLDMCLLGASVLVILIGGYYLYDNVSKRKEFEELMNTESKKEFLSNLDRIEELAYKLSTEHEEMVWEKKKELKIKRR